jgi:hypothetical protein
MPSLVFRQAGLETFGAEEENKTEFSVNLCVFSEQLCEIAIRFLLAVVRIF